MTPAKITGETRSIGKPANWNEATMGECGALSVRDEIDRGFNTMNSVWRPSADELRMLQNGAGVRLTIWGDVHPVVSMSVERPVMTETERLAEAMGG